MNEERINQNIAWAKTIGCYPIDLWGAEWWYWQHIHNKENIGDVAKDVVQRLDF